MVFLIFIFGTFFRFYQLSAHPLWIDEIYTGIFAHSDNTIREVLEWSFAPPLPRPPFIFLASHSLLSLFGQNTFALRLLGAVTGSLSILAIYQLGRLFFYRNVGLISAVLVAVSPLHIYHSREARYYSPVILFSLLSFIFLYQAIQSSQRRFWFGFTLSTILLIYTHLLASLFIVAQIAYILILFLIDHDVVRVRKISYADIRSSYVFPFVISLIISGVALLPMIPPILEWALNGTTFSSENTLYGIGITPGFFLDMYANFGAGRGIPLSLYASVFLFGILASWQNYSRQLVLLLICNSLPVFIVYFLQPQHWFSPKYVIFILPLYLIWVAFGIEYLVSLIMDISKRWKLTGRVKPVWTAVILGVFIFAALAKLEEAHFPNIDNWQAYREFLEANVKQGDTIVVFPNTIGTMENDRVLDYFGPFSNDVDVQVVADFSQLSEITRNSSRVWAIADSFTHLELAESIAVWMAGQISLPLNFDENDSIYFLGDFSSISEILSESEQFEIEFPAIYTSIGDAYISQNEIEKGELAYQSAITLDPSQGLWRFRLGEFYFRSGDLISAEREIKEAIRLDPQIPGFHAALGEIYARTGRTELAITEYQQAIQFWRQLYIGQTESDFLLGWQAALEQLQSSN
ncbi:MAG: phospholipid carrier-dependent glycosyltransferase [Chloroflexi bacterium]|nr:MAG: phospholipid carrier-dependent glycosyltransferase [Chloroflexota bacterium]MBL1196485.1 phospholipid carrier-dependent glycosyltransferase [Chloroflexota bacterium]